MRRSALFFVTAIAGLSLLLSADRAAAGSLVPRARIVRAQGEVKVKYAGTQDFVSVWRNDRVGPGDTVRTGADGAIDLVFGDESEAALGPFGTLTVSAIEPKRILEDTAEKRRAAADLSLGLVAGRLRAAVGPGSTLVLAIGAGEGVITVKTAPATGADVVAALGVFEWGEYVGVRGGCAFVSGPSAKDLPLCAVGGKPVGIGFPGGIMGSFDDSLPGLSFVGEPPVALIKASPVREITINGVRTIEGTDGMFLVRPVTGGAASKNAVIGGNVTAGSIVLLSRDGGDTWAAVLPDAGGRWEYPMTGAPRGGYDLVVKSVFVGETPAAPEAVVGTTPPAPSGVSEDRGRDDEIVSRFVQDLTGALNRGDTTALSSVIAADYSGTAGGTSRAALLRGASEFFRGGQSLSVSATAGGASRSGETIFATMTFTARSGGTTRSGSTKLWLSSDGKLTHAEGAWMY